MTDDVAAFVSHPVGTVAGVSSPTDEPRYSHDPSGDSRDVVPLPSTLWYQAHDEHPNDPEARTARYLDLMREAGHIVKREPGDDSPLFSCGYDPRKDTDG